MQTEEKKWKTLLRKIEHFIEKQNMIRQGEHIIAGISGGADSVCLLFVLLKLREKKQIKITVVHVNHMLRGEAAFEDEAFTEQLCRQNQIPFFRFRIQVSKEAKKRKCSEEEAGREIRKECLEKVLEQEEADHIALAHHQDDHAETVLMNLCRGTGLKGMRGILPCSGAYIRPLLCVQRAEIEEALREKGYRWCTDATNADNLYTRNRIRNVIMKELKDINPKVSAHIWGMSEKISAIWEYMETETAKYKEECTRKEKGRRIIMEEKFSHIPDPLKKEVLHSILTEVCGNEKDIGEIHIENLLKLMEKQTGKTLDLPYEMKATRMYEGISLSENRKEEWKEEKVRFKMRMVDRKEGENWPDTPYTKWFDYDIIKNSLIMRRRQPGDYITVDSSGSRQKLKDFFINQKIPREEREHIPLIADGHEIVWVVGYRQNKAYQVTEKTTRILEIEIYGGE